jgi:20S proteasome alpha/beta subunit
VTLIVAWRDPFCMVSDALETSITSATSSVGPKMTAVTESIAIGFAGFEGDYRKIVAEVRKLPVMDWDTFEMATRTIVDTLNAGKPCNLIAAIVVAGMIGCEAGIFDAVGPLEMSPTRMCAFAGSGGTYACAAKALATRYYRDPDAALGEDLLRTIVEAGVQADEWSAKPIHRINLGAPLLPYKWLE